MMSAECGHAIRGPKRKGGIYTYDQRRCRRRVAKEGDRCYQHQRRNVR